MERRVFIRERFGNGGDSFKVVIKKSESEESMEEGELSEDNTEAEWDTRTRVISRPDLPDILKEVCVDDRRVVEREEIAEKRREPVVTRVPVGRMADRKRKVGWGDADETKSKKSFLFSNFKQSIRDIVRDNEKSNIDPGPSEKVKTFTEKGHEDSISWEKKLKRPRMGMVADMVERRIPAKDRLHGGIEKREMIKRKVPNQKIERSIQLDVKPNRDRERDILMTEVVEEEEEEGFANIVRTVQIADEDTKKTGNRFAGRLGPSFGQLECGSLDHRDARQRIKKMEEKIQRRREVSNNQDNLEYDNGEDLPEWDETVVFQVPQNQLEIEKNNERRRQVVEELEMIEEAKQRDESRRKKEDLIRKEEKIEEMKRNEKHRKEQEFRRKEDLRIKQEEELIRQEEQIQDQMRIIERQKEIEKEKRDLEMKKQIKEKENLLKKKQLENEDRVKEEIRIVKEKEKRLVHEKKYKERKKAEKLREERRKEDKRRRELKHNLKDVEKEKKSRRRYSSEEDSSSESEESDSESSSSSESETDSSQTDSDDSEYERKRRKPKSKATVQSLSSKKERLLEKEKEARKAKERKQPEETRSNKKEIKVSNPTKPKEEQRSESNKDDEKEERKQTSEELKKTGELKDKLKSYLNRAKEAKENKKK